MLPHNLQSDSTLPGDHGAVIEGMHEGVAFLRHQRLRMGRGFVVSIAMQNHLAAQRFHGIDLDRRSGDGHDDDGLDAQPRAGHGHALGMIACRGGDHAFASGVCTESGHLVVGAAQLEAVHGLHVLALEQHFVVQTLRQNRGPVDGRLDGNVIDLGGENGFYILFHH